MYWFCGICWEFRWWVLCVLVRMSPEERFRIVRSVGEECIQEDELLKLLTNRPVPICYDGFEPSGRMHIAQVLFSLCWVGLLNLAHYGLIVYSYVVWLDYSWHWRWCYALARLVHWCSIKNSCFAPGTCLLFGNYVHSEISNARQGLSGPVFVTKLFSQSSVKVWDETVLSYNIAVCSFLSTGYHLEMSKHPWSFYKVSLKVMTDLQSFFCTIKLERCLVS